MASCLRCHRSLKDPVSIERLFGPHCWALVQQDTTDVFPGWEEYPAESAEPTQEAIA